MEKIIIHKLNEVYNKIECEPSVAFELKEYFKFSVPGAKFTPAFKNKIWDGFIYLYNPITQLLYAGLNRYVEEFCKARNYEVEYNHNFSSEEFSIKEAKDFIITLNSRYTPRDYQLDAFVHAVRERRALMLSPTASGKSFIIYLLTRYYNARTLIIVPNTSLVSQLASDFADYGFQSDKFVHRIYAGQDKQTDKPITIATWQSIYKLPKEYFQQFDVVIGDEAHLFKAKSLTSILTKLDNCKYRFGFTGTLDGTQTHKLVLEGLFGSVRRVTTTSELIKQKHLAEFKIKAIVLTYPDEIRQMITRANDYQSEMDYIVRLQARNNFIRNLALSLEGNTLLLFQYVEKHGKVLFDMIKNEAKDRNVFYVSGSVNGEEREEIRRIVENHKDERIVFEFGKLVVKCFPEKEVELINGKTKLAKYINENDDISEEWIINNREQ